MKTGNTTDTLLERAIAGDEAAFQALFKRFAGRLGHYLSDRRGARLASQVDPEDLVQEVFAEVFPRIQRFEPRGKGSFYKLLLTIANRRLLNVQRRLAVRPEGHLAPGGSDLLLQGEGRLFESDDTGPLTALLREEDRQLCRRAYQELPAKDRQVLWLRMVEGRSAAEIGLRTGKTVGAVWVWFHRALKAWSEKLDELRGR